MDAEMNRRDFLFTAAAAGVACAVPSSGEEPLGLEDMDGRIDCIACELPMNVRLAKDRNGGRLTWEDFEATIDSSVEFHFPRQHAAKTASGGVVEMYRGDLGASINFYDRPRPVTYEIRWKHHGNDFREISVLRAIAARETRPDDWPSVIEYHVDKQWTV